MKYNIALIADSVITTEEAHHFLQQITAFTASLYDIKHNNQIDKIELHLPYDKKDVILETLQSNNIDLSDVIQLQELFSEIKSELEGRAIVYLQLPVMPTYAFLQKLYEWLRLNIRDKVLIDITINKTLIAGMILGYKGIYKDFSLRSKIDHYFNKNHI